MITVKLKVSTKLCEMMTVKLKALTKLCEMMTAKLKFQQNCAKLKVSSTLVVFKMVLSNKTPQTCLKKEGFHLYR